MSDINREDQSDILTRIEKNRWPKIAGISAILSLLVSLLALVLQFWGCERKPADVVFQPNLTVYDLEVSNGCNIEGKRDRLILSHCAEWTQNSRDATLRELSLARNSERGWTIEKEEKDFIHTKQNLRNMEEPINDFFREQIQVIKSKKECHDSAIEKLIFNQRSECEKVRAKYLLLGFK